MSGFLRSRYLRRLIGSLPAKKGENKVSLDVPVQL